jgi:hypothetical protein
MRGLQIDTLIALTALMATIVAGFGTIARLLWRIELKVDTMWKWFIEGDPDTHRGGRRAYDPKVIRRGQ